MHGSTQTVESRLQSDRALMREAGLRGVSRRRRYRVTTQRDAASRAAADLVNRQFVARPPTSSG